MIGRLNHVAIAVPDLEAAAEQYRSALGAKVGPPQDELGDRHIRDLDVGQRTRVDDGHDAGPFSGPEGLPGLAWAPGRAW